MFGSDLEGEGLARCFSNKGSLISLPNQRIHNWQPLVYELEGGGFTDLQNENKDVRLCSEKLRSLLEELASEQDEFQWLDAIVRKGQQEHPYYVLHFPNPPPVLDKESCYYSELSGKLIAPVPSASLCKNRNIFTCPEMNRVMFVRDTVKKAIQSEGCTGITFETVRVGK